MVSQPCVCIYDENNAVVEAVTADSADLDYEWNHNVEIFTIRNKNKVAFGTIDKWEDALVKYRDSVMLEAAE